MNNEISLASHWSHSFNLDSLDFLRIKSSLVQQKSEGAQGMNNANNQHEDNLELVDFVDYINAKRLFNQCSLNEQKHKKILSSGDGDDTNTNYILKKIFPNNQKSDVIILINDFFCRKK